MTYSTAEHDEVNALLPDLSVVIVGFRCKDLLLACLDSLVTQRQDVDMELLVIDNASNDGSVEAVQSAHPWVRVTALDANIGFARANNLGFRQARGKAVLALNPDTVVPPGALGACLEYLWAHCDIGVLTPRLVDVDGNLDRRCKRGFPTLWSSFCYFTGLDRYLRGPRSTRYTAGYLPEDQAGEVESVTGAFMLMRAEALSEVGGFDEQFFMYAEDIDLCLRFRSAGWKVIYWPGVDVIHVGAGSNSSGRRSAEANAAYFRTMAPFIRKHRPGWRGRVLSAIVAALSEALLAASRIRSALSHRPGVRRAETALEGSPQPGAGASHKSNAGS